jgi:hypothetical protein
MKSTVRNNKKEEKVQQKIEKELRKSLEEKELHLLKNGNILILFLIWFST